MKTKLKNIFLFIKNHKKKSAAASVLLLLLVWIFAHSDGAEAQTRYVFARVERQDVGLSVTGSGQVSTLDEANISAEVSGDITHVAVKAGDRVRKGQLIAYIDATDAKRSVENAELALENAKISYEKSLKQSDNQASGSAISDLKKAYDEGRMAVSNVMIDVPDMIDGLDAIFYEPTNSPYFGDMSIMNTAGRTAVDYKYEAGRKFDEGKKDYEAAFRAYKALPPDYSEAEIVSLLEQNFEMAQKMSLALSGTYNAIDYIKARTSPEMVSAQIAADKSKLSGFISKINSHVTKLSDALTAIEDAKDSTIEATLSLKSAEIKLGEAEDNLNTAKKNLANHSITSPFDGVVAKVPVETGDKVNTGGTVATVISDDMKVSISLNELDAIKVSVGDKAILTFDAIEGLSIEGQVYEVDVVGTVNSGVVSYNVDISFDKSDERIKSGMTANVAIQSQSVSNVTAVSTAAISEKNGKSFVLVPISNSTRESITDASLLKEVEVETGLSGYEYTEIKFGLSEGETYVSRVVSGAAAQNGSSGSLFNMFGSGQGRRTNTATGSVRVTAPGSASPASSQGSGPQNVRFETR